MNKSGDLSESVIFPKGERIRNDHSIGAAWLTMLVPKDSTFNCAIGNVTFAGARTNWQHPGGPLL
jgi:hypothetical protein